MMEALETLRAQGKIRFVGVSNFSVRDMENASQGGRIDAHQLCYNLLWRHPEKEIIPWCRAHDVPMITYSSIAQGLLSDTPRSPSTFEKGDARQKTLYCREDVWPHARNAVSAMGETAARRGTPLSTLAIRWVLGRKGIVSSLVGARSKAQLEENAAAAAGRDLPEINEELTRLSSEAMRDVLRRAAGQIGFELQTFIDPAEMPWESLGDYQGLIIAKESGSLPPNRTLSGQRRNTNRPSLDLPRRAAQSSRSITGLPPTTWKAPTSRRCAGGSSFTRWSIRGSKYAPSSWNIPYSPDSKVSF